MAQDPREVAAEEALAPEDSVAEGRVSRGPHFSQGPRTVPPLRCSGRKGDDASFFPQVWLFAGTAQAPLQGGSGGGRTELQKREDGDFGCWRILSRRCDPGLQPQFPSCLQAMTPPNPHTASFCWVSRP